MSTDRKSNETSRPIKTVVKCLSQDGFFFGKRLQINERTKILQNKYNSAREDSDRVKMDLKSCVEINRLMFTAFSPTRVFQISGGSQDKDLTRSATRLDKVIENL